MLSRKLEQHIHEVLTSSLVTRLSESFGFPVFLDYGLQFLIELLVNLRSKAQSILVNTS